MLVTDTTGRVRAVSETAYTPSPRLRRHLHARDRRCSFPACGATVWHCDADHNIPHARGGCTDTDNCGLLCRRRHRLKTSTRWTWRRLGDDTVQWTDPNGHTWYREPVHYSLPPPDRPPPHQPRPGSTQVDYGDPPF